MELFEQIRREHDFGVGTIAGVARKLGVHRRMVREALRSAEPAAPKPQQRRLRKLDEVSDFIDQILRADVAAPPKHGTRQAAFLTGCGTNCRASAAASAQCADTYNAGASNWASSTAKCLSRRPTTGDRKRRSIGTKPGRF